MCCCQLAAAVAHLLPVLNSSCLCFVGPKTGARFWTKKLGHNAKIKISSPASKFVATILGPWYMRFAFCKEHVELRQVASFIHVFLRLVPGCWFHSTLYFTVKFACVKCIIHFRKNTRKSERPKFVRRIVFFNCWRVDEK